jgi:hypothetical protein
METFLLIGAIVVTLSALVAIYRLNNNLARILPTEMDTVIGGKTVHLLNVTGKWLTVAGGVATFPLVMALIFTPESSANWVTTLGVLGCLALLIAALLIIPTCIGQCLARKVSLKRVALTAYHYTLKKGRILAGYKTLGLIVGVVVLATFIPFMADLLTFIVYAAVLLAAGRLGLLNGHDGRKRNYFGNTDHMKEGADYDFYSGSNIYDSFPD